MEALNEMLRWLLWGCLMLPGLVGLVWWLRKLGRWLRGREPNPPWRDRKVERQRRSSPIVAAGRGRFSERLARPPATPAGDAASEHRIND